LRYDYQTYLKEQYGRLPSISTTVPNPAAGNLPGGVIFEATCKCDFAKNYPFGFGPRLGVAYQITPKTVFRAGWGVSYGQTSANNMWSLRFGSNVPFAAPAFGAPAMLLKDGVPIQPVWPDFNPGQFPANPASPSYFLTMIDRSAGRPPRQMMWSIGLQRQLTTNLAIEATYVGNRGVWWTSSMIDVNRLTPQILAKNGLDISKQADRDLLNARLDSSLAASRGFNKPPYPSFSKALTVGQSLRPFPMFTAINDLWAPVGNTWYDSLQAKVPKRYSHGLDFSVAFNWQKELTIGAEAEDPYNFSIPVSVNDSLNRPVNKYLSGYSQPFRLVLAGNYRLPALHLNKVLSYAIRDWTFGTVLQYSSGLPIRAPYANNQIGTLLKLCNPITVAPIQGGCVGPTSAAAGTFANRVPDQPLFTKDLNSHTVDPNKDFVLNPKAWADPPAGQFGVGAAYYGDYRFQRRPSESMSLGRTFRFSEKASLNVRIEFNNVFNRTEMTNPTATNAGATQVTNAAGKAISGFGFINTASLAVQPRTGQLVARFQF
jgi:hypothetical protein